jgi:solanesyl diphosphate synthase
LSLNSAPSSCTVRMPSQFLIQMNSFSASTTSSFIPDYIKDYFKKSVLDDAARPDTKLWSDSYDNPPAKHQHSSKHDVNGSFRLNGAALNTDTSQITKTPVGNVNDAISPARLYMLNDPLDEWHLDHTPSYIKPPTMTPETDPFILSKEDMSNLSKSIQADLIGNNHPVLSKAASYFFEEGQDGGKKVRPMMVLLLSRAMNMAHAKPSSNMNTTSATSVNGIPRSDLFKAQRRLAEISEMIHTASLFHDDVIDDADTRRGSPSVHKVFGNKMAILAGDYLLARASIFLARLRDVEVVETMSTIIEHLVRGEVMQMKGADVRDDQNQRMVQYLRKNFYKTASLMANSCKSAAILAGYNDKIVSAAYRYGKHLGIAFQLVDDVLDYEGSASAMGKPALSDLNAGLATAPVLFATETFAGELEPMIDRKFKNEGDVERALDFVRRSDGIERTKALAQVHVELAIEAILELAPNKYRDSLIHLAHKVVDRTR